jgi:hypothetical protein
MSGKLHAPAASSLKKETPVLIEEEAGWRFQRTYIATAMIRTKIPHSFSPQPSQYAATPGGYSTFVVGAASAKFVLHRGNMKLSTHHLVLSLSALTPLTNLYKILNYTLLLSV